MIVGVGEIRARCESCGGKEFEDVAPDALRVGTQLKCTKCGRRTLYGDLLEQIGERAMKQASDSLAKLRGKKDE